MRHLQRVVRLVRDDVELPYERIDVQTFRDLVVEPQDEIERQESAMVARIGRFQLQAILRGKVPSVCTSTAAWRSL